MFSKGPPSQMQRLKGTGFMQFEVCLASCPGQFRLDFMKPFAFPGYHRSRQGACLGGGEDG